MRKTTVIVMLLAFSTLWISACSAGEDRNLKITFDGENCTYEGPSELKSGPVTLDFYNESDSVAAMNFMRHTGNESIQGMIDYLGPDPSPKHQPEWVQDLGTWKRFLPGNSYTFELILKPGVHTMVCGSFVPYEIWFGTGLTVQE